MFRRAGKGEPFDRLRTNEVWEFREGESMADHAVSDDPAVQAQLDPLMSM